MVHVRRPSEVMLLSKDIMPIPSCLPSYLQTPPSTFVFCLGQSTSVPLQPTSCDRAWWTKQSRKIVVVLSVKQTDADLILPVVVQREVTKV